MSNQSNRRDFLKTSAAFAGAGYWVATRSAFAQSRSPNEKLNVACIGVGGRGSGNVGGVSGENIVALCDVDERNAAGSFEKFPKAKRYQDFRKMFDEMGKEIDAVTVSTPDHMHFVATLMAMKLGKHVYCEKPLTHDIWEARTLTELASQHPNLATQMGNQGTSENGLREAVEVIRAGTIGDVREVHVWTNRPVWPQSIDAILRNKAVQKALTGKGEAVQAPNSMAWDLWLGTAPMRPYDPVYAPFNWRGWWDFGTGALGDMACHTANMAFMACELGYPISIEATTSELNDQTYPMWSVIEYKFPERSSKHTGKTLPPLTWTWYDGTPKDKPAWVNKKLRELAHGNNIPDSGSIIVGDKGTLFSPNDYGASYKLLPEGDFANFQKPAQQLPRVNGAHHQEWIRACKGEGKTMSNFGYAGPLTETVLLGNVAMRILLNGEAIKKAGTHKLLWDGPALKFTNIPEANAFIKREYRGNWM